MRCNDIGPLDAKIMLVGEAPGAEEERTGLPFQGWSGRLLKQMLSSAGIDFNMCYVTNVMNIRPTGNDFALFYTDKKKKLPSSDLLEGVKRLHETIDRIKPNVIICLGGEALRAVTNKIGIMNWRGSMVEADIKGTKRKVIATYHPAAVLRQMSWRLICELDFRKAQRESATAALKKTNYKIVIIPTIQQAIIWFQEMKYHKPSRIAFDLETTYEDQMIRSCGFAYRDNVGVIRAISVPFMINAASNINVLGSTISLPCSATTSKSYWPVPHEMMILDMMNAVFENENIEKVGQNSITFDQPLLEKQFGITIKNHKMDTMQVHHACYIELPKGLDFLCTFYTNIANYWSDKVTEDDKSNATYNAMDCVATLECSEKLDVEMRELDTTSLYFNHIHPLTFSLTRAMERGVHYDNDARNKLKKEYEDKLAELQVTINKLAKKEINVNSPKQLKELLYDELRYPVHTNAEGNQTTDEEALKSLLRKYPTDEILQRILDYREYSKVVSTYLDVELDSDGLFRTSFDPAGTDTGRLSSSKTIRRTGGNIQNIPEDLRSLIIARPGYTLIKGDLSQAETLVVSEILTRYGDYTLRERYRDPKFDIHVWAACDIFGCRPEEVAKWMRQIAKIGNHSGNYKAGPGVLVATGLKRNVTFADGRFIDFSFAKKILATRARLIPGLQLWWDDVERTLRTTRVITTCFGRKRIFFDRADDQTTVRAAVAFEPQSVVGDLACMIFWKLEEAFISEFKDPDIAYPLINVHDEVDVECKDEYVARAIEIYKDVAKIPMMIAKDQPLIIPIDIGCGKNWKDCKC